MYNTSLNHFHLNRLGILLGMKIYIDLINLDFDECFEKLTKELGKLNQENDLSNDFVKTEVKNIHREIIQVDPEINIKTKKEISYELGVMETSVSSWSEEDVCNWFRNKKIKVSIREYLTPCDGKVLEELFKISKESRDFFLTKLDLDSNVNLKDIAFFRVELRSLFMKN
jgi:hypothetical protein